MIYRKNFIFVNSHPKMSENLRDARLYRTFPTIPILQMNLSEMQERSTALGIDCQDCNLEALSSKLFERLAGIDSELHEVDREQALEAVTRALEAHGICAEFKKDGDLRGGAVHAFHFVGTGERQCLSNPEYTHGKKSKKGCPFIVTVAHGGLIRYMCFSTTCRKAAGGFVTIGATGGARPTGA